MERTLISQLPERVGCQVALCAWVHKIRDQKQMQFIILRDHTGLAQVTLQKLTAPELAEIVSSLTRESTVRAIGHVSENPRVGLEGIEIHLSELRVESQAASPLPIDPFSQSPAGLDSRLDWRKISDPDVLPP